MELQTQQPEKQFSFTYSTEKVKEILKMNCFEINRSGNIYHCNRPNTKEIKFRESFGGEQVFYVDKIWCHNVHRVIELAQKVS